VRLTAAEGKRAYNLIFDALKASELITSATSTFSPALIEVVARDFMVRSPGRRYWGSSPISDFAKMARSE
jgi:hypothetical protein